MNQAELKRLGLRVAMVEVDMVSGVVGRLGDRTRSGVDVVNYLAGSAGVGVGAGAGAAFASASNFSAFFS